MRWFVAVMIALSLVDLLLMRRTWRGMPRGELMRRAHLQSAAAMIIFCGSLLLGERWMWLGLAGVPLFVSGFRTMNRVTRAQNAEALERWRAKGSPPPLPRYDASD